MKKGAGVINRRRFFSGLVLAGLLLVSAATWASSGGEHAAESKGWQRTDTYRVVNFVVLAGVLVLLLRKPLSQALRARTRGIEEQLKELEAEKEEAAKQIAQYKERMNRLEEEAQQIVSEYTKQGVAAKERILEAARSAAERLQEQARRNMEQEFEDAKKALREEVLERAVALAEEIIRKNMTSEDQDRLVGEYIEKVVVQ